MSNTVHPTETDCLIPKQSSNLRDETRNGNYRLVVMCIAIFFASAIIGYNHHQTNLGLYDAKSQLQQLNTLTQTSLDDLFGIHFPEIHFPLLGRPHVQRKEQSDKNKHGKMSVLTDKDVNPKIYHCTSTLMIMRHCDKGVKVKRHGLTRVIDPKDENGDLHCNPKGVARSEYIASLFVEPERYQRLVHNLGASHAAIPPVPMVTSSLQKNKKVGNNPAKKKPQFPTPLKLYALSDGRNRHRNFREIETVTPLANKFGLEVDDRFGLYEEKDLARDYFGMLSDSVLSNVDRMRRSANINSPDATTSETQQDSHQLCNNGLTVVNWKHSRIPSLARALGCGRDEGCPKKYYSKDFDTMWMVTFQYSLRLDGGGVPEVLNMMGSSSKDERRARKDRHGSWMISAQLVNEGFDPIPR